MKVVNFLQLTISVVLYTAFMPTAFSANSNAVTIEAANAQVDDQNGVSIYTGGVVIIQGSLVIHADKVTAHHPNNEVGKMVAEGSPATYTQPASGPNAAVSASANTIHYLTAEDKIILVGNAHLDQDGNTIEGERITYDLKRKVGNAAAGKSNSTKKQDGRVKMIFQPKSKPADNK